MSRILISLDSKPKPKFLRVKDSGVFQSAKECPVPQKKRRSLKSTHMSPYLGTWERRSLESTHVYFLFGNQRANHSSQGKCSLSEQNRVLFKLKLWVGGLVFWNSLSSPRLHPMFFGYTLLCDIQDCQTFWSHRHSAHNQSQYALSKLDLFSAEWQLRIVWLHAYESVTPYC